jgi:hypothetical protein
MTATLPPSGQLSNEANTVDQQRQLFENLRDCVEVLQEDGGGGSGGSLSTGTAGVNISGDMLLVLVNGFLYPADPTNVAHGPLVVGVSIGAGLANSTITYATSGDVAGGSWTQGSRYYAGANGILSTTPQAPGATWQKSVGIAKSASVLTLNMGPTILL